MTITLKMPIAVALLLGLTWCADAIAGPTWLCSISDAVSCDADGTIEPPDFGGREAPTFFRVNADTKEVTLLAPESRQGEVTTIDRIQEGKDLYVFTGVEDGRAWSLVISEKGHVTLSVTTDGATWSVFGSALREE